MKRFLLYLFRWQCSTPILSIVTYFTIDKIGSIGSAVLANLIGGIIFYKIDKIIFTKKKTDEKDKTCV